MSKPSESELRVILDELTSSRSKLRAFINSSTDINFLLSGPPDYNVLSFNMAAEKAGFALFNRHIKEGDSFLDFTVPDLQEKFRKDVASALAGTPVQEERQVDYGDGRTVFWSATYAPAYSDEGEIIAVTFNLTNIDAQRKYEIKLEEQNKKLRDIAYYQSHELRKPVSNLLTLLPLFDESEFSEANKEVVQRARQSLKELDTLIHEIVALTESEEVKDIFNPKS